MPRVLDRYLFREAFLLFWAGLLTFIFVLVSSRVIYELFDYLFNLNLSQEIVWKLFKTQLPKLALDSAPGALLFAIFLATGRLSRELETPTMFWAGIHPWRLIIPYFFLAAGVTVLIWWFREAVVTPNQQTYMELRKVYVQGEGEERILLDAAFRLDEARMIYAKSVDFETGAMQQVLVLRREGDKIISLMSAPTASWVSNSITLHQGAAAEYKNDKFYQGVKTVDRSLDAGRPISSLKSVKLDPGLLSMKELQNQIGFKNLSGLESRELQTEYWLRYSFPLSCFIIVLFTVPLGYRMGKQEQLVNGVIAVFLVSFYWGLMAVARSLANRGALEGLLGEHTIQILAFSQNIVLVVLASVVLLVHRLIIR